MSGANCAVTFFLRVHELTSEPAVFFQGQVVVSLSIRLGISSMVQAIIANDLAPNERAARAVLQRFGSALLPADPSSLEGRSQVFAAIQPSLDAILASVHSVIEQTP